MILLNRAENLVLSSIDVKANGPKEFEGGLDILAQHQEIADSGVIPQVENPYWQFTRNTGPEVPYYEAYTRGHLKVYMGEIASFSPQHVATIVEGTARNYINAATFGDFPVQNQYEVDQLLAVMISGFDQNRLIVSICDDKTSRWIGACMVVPGKSEEIVPNLIGSPKANLSTLAALQFNLNGDPVSEGMKSTSEDHVVCDTRFSRIPTRELETLVTSPSDLPEYLRDFSMETLSSMARVVQHFSTLHGRDLRYGLLDTHDESIISTLQKYYGAVEIAYPAVPTAAMISKDNPLAHHYRTYMNNVSIQAWRLSTFFSKAENVDRRLDSQYGPKVDLYSLV